MRRAGRDVFGRARELAELTEALDNAREGHGRLVLVAGEPGIGKTRLAEQVASVAAERGTRVAWGRCWEGGGAPPYWPWAQIVQAVAEDQDDATVIGWLGAGAAPLAPLAPELAVRLSSADSGGAALSSPLSQPPSVDSDATRFYLFEAMAAFLRRASADQPLLLIIDDLHAADDPSLLLLRHLARSLRGARLLMLGTYRDVEIGWSSSLSDTVAALVREGQLTTLRGLASADVQALIGDMADIAPSEATVQAVYEATEGNPLFVREAVRLLAASGKLDQPGRPAIPIPGSVRALIQQRLTPLSADGVQVLAAAAVVGRDFDLALVGPACALPTDRILTATNEAVSLGVVVEESAALGRYRFSHSLMREVIYESLPLPARAGLHLAVGEAIEQRYGTESDSHITELARHFAEVASTGEGVRALAYMRRAGDRAMQAHAYEEAVSAYQRALGTVELAGADEAQRGELLLRLGGAQVRAARYTEAKETHGQAAAVARRLALPDQLARAALGFGEPQVEGGHVNRQLVALLREALDAASEDDAPLRARLLARLSVELTFSEEVHLTDGLSRQAVEMARRLADVRSLGDALDARWMAVWGPDGLPERTGLAGEILALAQATGDREIELLGRGQRVTTALEAGDMLAAESDMAIYARLADELRMPVYQWTALTMRATRALLLGAFDEAATLADEAVALQPERPNAQWAHANVQALVFWERGRLGELRETWQPLVERFPRAAFARGWLALADIERGEPDNASRALQVLAEQLPVRPRSGLWLPGVALAAQTAALLEDADAAGRLYAALRPYAGHIIAMTMEHPVVCFGSSSHYLGLLATVTRAWDAAAGHFTAALSEHERLGAAPFLAHTRYEYAKMLMRRGWAADREQAHDLLERVATSAQALGMAGLTAQIGVLREQGSQAEASTPSTAVVSVIPAGSPAAVHLPADAPGASLTVPSGVPPASPAPADDPQMPAATAPAAGPHVPTAAGQADEQFVREGEFWTVSFDGLTVRLKDSKGLRQIALLLARPGLELHATDLESLVAGPAVPAAPSSASRAAANDLGMRADAGDAGELLDPEARAAYKARLDELQEEIDEAEAFNDPERAEQAREERAFLVRELARAVGLGGRDRKAASHAERARLNATRAIRSAMTNLTREHPSLGQHLAATIRTGRYCSYTPDPRSPVAWKL